MSRPMYCPCKYETPDPCPACGATVAGNDPVRGVCQATRGSEPQRSVELVVYRKGSPDDPLYAPGRMRGMGGGR